MFGPSPVSIYNISTGLTLEAWIGPVTVPYADEFATTTAHLSASQILRFSVLKSLLSRSLDRLPELHAIDLVDLIRLAIQPRMSGTRYIMHKSCATTKSYSHPRHESEERLHVHVSSPVLIQICIRHGFHL